MKYWTIGIMLMVSTLTSLSTYASVFKPQSFTLENGLQVVVVENHLAPAVSIGLVYKVGTADDPPHMIGLSHFLEHLMFKGTKDIPAGEFKRLIVSKGGQINASTSFDQTVYTCDIAIEYLEMVLKIEADRMQNLVFDPKEIDAEHKVVMEERLMRMENHPLGQAFEAVLRSLYWYHPYGVPPIGYPAHIAAYTREALESHYKKWYVPNNAILIVSGDVTVETLKPLVEKYFSAIPSQSLANRVRIKEPDHQGLVSHLEFESPRLSMVNMSWYYSAPNHRSDQKKHYYPLIVLAQVLGGNSSSRLYKSLVDNKQTGQVAALDVHADYSGDSLDNQTFVLSTTLHPATSPEKMKGLLEHQIQELLSKGITEEELQRAKRDLIADFAFARDGNDGAIDAFSHLSVGFTIEDIESWPETVKNVTAEEVLSAAKFVLEKSLLATLIVYPKGYKQAVKASPQKAEKK